MSRVLAATLLGAVLLAGCASPTPVSPTPRTSTPTTLALSSGIGLVAEGTIDDPVGDLVDHPVGVPAKPVGTPAYIDIRTLMAVADGTTLRLTLTLAGVLPAAPSPTIERLFYMVALHTDGDAVRERDDPRVGIGYSVRLMNEVGGDYEPELVDWSGSDPIYHRGSSFPGTADVAGDTVVLTVPLAALGDPYVIRVGAWTMRQDPAHGRLTNAEDFLPDSGGNGLATREFLTLAP